MEKYSAYNPSTDYTHRRSVGEVAALHGELLVRAAANAVFAGCETTLVRGDMAEE
jgi:hypothetical protein